MMTPAEHPTGESVPGDGTIHTRESGGNGSLLAAAASGRHYSAESRAIRTMIFLTG